jgi:hypothetical protein
LTHNPLSHILNSLKSDFCRDLEALKTTHNFVIVCSNSNHFGNPKRVYKTAKVSVCSKAQQLIGSSGDQGGNQPCMRE